MPYPYSLLTNLQSVESCRLRNSEVVGSMNLRMSKEVAEIEPPENHFEKEVQIRKEDLEKFQQNLSKIVFDGNGNYIYTKADPLTQEQKQTLDVLLCSAIP